MTQHEHRHDHDQGLAHDLDTLAEFAARRRALLKWGLGLGILPLAACAGTNLDAMSESTGGTGSSDNTSGTSSADTSAAGAGSDTNASSATTSCSTIPEETAGPYPGDGTNGPNALALSGIVRSDIRSSLAGASGVAEGVELTVTLTVLDGQKGCAPLAGYAVYLWHCDRDGNYSMYSAAAANENYLRGVQETDADGRVTFTTVFPGCYSGRWPHIHFEVYPSLDMASTGANKVATSQLALPENSCDDVYALAGYETSVANLARISLTSDNVFSDGVSLQLPAMSGSADAGLVAKLNVTV